MALSVAESLAFIQSRRSIYPKEFEGTDVTREEIEQLIEAARYAPTHKHTEPWRFKVFQGTALTQLAETQVKALFAAKGENEMTLKKAEKMRYNAAHSGAVIAIVMRRDELERVSLNDEVWAVACAVQNMHLHAASLGLSGFWSTGAAVNFPEIRALLDLNEQDLHMGWFYLGRFSGEKPRFKDRASVAEITRFM
jgi:nitroreductase